VSGYLALSFLREGMYFCKGHVLILGGGYCIMLGVNVSSHFFVCEFNVNDESEFYFCYFYFIFDTGLQAVLFAGSGPHPYPRADPMQGLSLLPSLC